MSAGRERTSRVVGRLKRRDGFKGTWEWEREMRSALGEREKRKPARKRNKVSVLIKSESERMTWKMERESDGVGREGLKNRT